MKKSNNLLIWLLAIIAISLVTYKGCSYKSEEVIPSRVEDMFIRPAEPIEDLDSDIVVIPEYVTKKNVRNDPEVGDYFYKSTAGVYLTRAEIENLGFIVSGAYTSSSYVRTEDVEEGVIADAICLLDDGSVAIYKNGSTTINAPFGGSKVLTNIGYNSVEEYYYVITNDNNVYTTKDGITFTFEYDCPYDVETVSIKSMNGYTVILCNYIAYVKRENGGQFGALFSDIGLNRNFVDWVYNTVNNTIYIVGDECYAFDTTNDYAIHAIDNNYGNALGIAINGAGYDMTLFTDNNYGYGFSGYTVSSYMYNTVFGQSVYLGNGVIAGIETDTDVSLYSFAQMTYVDAAIATSTCLRVTMDDDYIYFANNGDLGRVSRVDQSVDYITMSGDYGITDFAICNERWR